MLTDLYAMTMSVDLGRKLAKQTKQNVSKIFEHKSVNIFLPISFNLCFGFG